MVVDRGSWVAGPGARRTGARTRLVALLALLLTSFGITGPQAVAASDHKTFTAGVSPSTVPAGASRTFTATLTNTSTRHQLGSANVTAPASLSLTAAGRPTVALQGIDITPTTATATLNGDTVELRGLSAPPRATVQITIDGAAACTASDGTWTVVAKQANDFNGPPGNDLVLSGSAPTLTVTGSCRLAFVDHPNHAEAGAVISRVAGDPNGGAVTVAAVDGDDQPVTSFTGDVTVAIGADPSGAPAVLSGTTTRAAVAGVASFGDLSIDRLGVGYTLVASSAGFEPATSRSFGIWQDIALCQAGDTCTATADDPGSMSASVTGTSPTSGAILLAFAVDSVDCGDTGANHAPTVTTVDSLGIDGVKTATITVAKAVDQLQPNNGVSFYEVCYKSPIAFTDQDGATTNEGLLPDCGSHLAPPCVASRTKTKAGDVQIVVSLPAIDPSFK